MKEMPLASRLLFTLCAVALPIGAHIADLSKSHLFNDRWPPHAKFHTGQTLSMSFFLSLLTIIFAWRKSFDPNMEVFATAGFAAAYWVAQAAAILYPNTAYYDPEFGTSKPRSRGVLILIPLEIVFLSLIAVASWLALREFAN